jgi:hypothetical protein
MISGRDDMDDDGGDIRWMTYAELGKVRAISTASATRLAFRRKWRRQGGNGNTVRVAVPIDEAKPQSDKTHDDRDDDRGDITRTINVLEGAIFTLREQLEQANKQAVEQAIELRQVREQVERERSRSDRAEASAATDREKLTTEQTTREKAEAEAKRLQQADQVRRSRGLIVRLRSAWRGE